MNNTQQILQIIKSSFDQLWSFKNKGDKTIEIQTPYSTTSSKFVTLYMTYQNDQFVVTDGGLLYEEAYGSSIDYDNQCLLKILYHLESYYQIKKTQHKNGTKHYYRTTTQETLVPNLVYDMAQFISMCVSSATVEFEDLNEITERNTYKKEANIFIRSHLSDDKTIKFNGYLDKEKYRTVRFSAIVESKNRLSLVNYVTGSNHTHFMGSIARANMNFELATSSKYNDYIDNKLVLLNDSADGYSPNKFAQQLQLLEQNTERPAIFWSQRDDLLKYLN